MGTLIQPGGTWLNQSVTHGYDERLVWSDEAAMIESFNDSAVQY